MQPEKPLPPERAWLDRLRLRFDRFLSGQAPSDPLYLTNRTLGQKLKVAALIGVPLLILGALVMAGAAGMFRINRADPFERPLTEAQPAPATKRMPDPRLTRVDLEILNIRIVKDENPPVVTGVIRNNTNRKVDSAEVSFDLSDERGSLMGSETTYVQNVEPHSTVTFRAPVRATNAQYVLVREVRSN